MLPLNPPNPHLIKRQRPPTITTPTRSIALLYFYNSGLLPASDTCGQKVTRRLIFHGPCTVGRVIQSEFPQSACIYMKSSHSASVTSPALPAPPSLQNTHLLQPEREREEAASFVRVNKIIKKTRFFFISLTDELTASKCWSCTVKGTDVLNLWSRVCVQGQHRQWWSRPLKLKKRRRKNLNLHFCHIGLTNFSFLPSQILSISRQGKNTSFINGSKNPKESCEAQNK